MPRKTPKIEIPPKDREILIIRVRSRTLPKQMVDRAKMILDSGHGKPVKQIAEELQTYPNKVIYWRKRYLEYGLNGLKDRPRSGRPKLYGDEFRNNVLALLGEPPPKGLAAWDGPALSKELNAPVDAIWKEEDHTAIRISYTDNFRVVGNGKACRWEIFVDGVSCPSGKLLYDRANFKTI